MPAKREIHSEQFPIEQKSIIEGDVLPERSGEIAVADESIHEDYLTELEMAEEPVTIRLEGSRDKNAATMIPIWCNGKGCEVRLRNGKWKEVTWIPVNTVVTVKRKYMEILAAAKLDEVTTDYDEPGVARPRNAIRRSTYAFQAFAVIEDKNPKGVKRLEEIRRRNF